MGNYWWMFYLDTLRYNASKLQCYLVVYLVKWQEIKKSWFKKRDQESYNQEGIADCNDIFFGFSLLFRLCNTRHIGQHDKSWHFDQISWFEFCIGMLVSFTIQYQYFHLCSQKWAIQKGLHLLPKKGEYQNVLIVSLFIKIHTESIYSNHRDGIGSIWIIRIGEQYLLPGIAHLKALPPNSLEWWQHWPIHLHQNSQILAMCLRQKVVRTVFLALQSKISWANFFTIS